MTGIAERPNILYFHTHDTGRYIQPYGYGVSTPNYQRLAAGGTLFRQAFCAGPTCSPSRAALLTGECPHAAGMIELAHMGGALTDYSRHLVNHLRPAGYRSTLIGFQHVAAEESVDQIGYDEIQSVVEHRWAADVIPATVAFLQRSPADRGEPFFLSCGIVETHRPFPAPDAAAARYLRPPAPLPDTPETRADMAGFAASLTIADAALGTILDTLEATGLAGNTLILCTTDHGPPFPKMKTMLTDHGLGVLLLLAGPGIPAGRVIDGMVQHLDLYPTLCALLGLDQPAWLQGRSLLPLLHGDATEIHDAVFSETTYHAGHYLPYRAVRTTRWKYIRRFADNEFSATRLGEGPSSVFLDGFGWSRLPAATEQLYDLILDPNEVCNLASDPAFAAVKADLAGRLHQWQQQTDDPLLRGPIDQPSTTSSQRSGEAGRPQPTKSAG